MSKVIAVIFAGGTGKRAGAGSKPKQFLEVNGKPIIIHTLDHFQNHPQIDEIFIVCIGEYIAHMEQLIREYHVTKTRAVIPGGATSQDSIYLGLKEAAKTNTGEAVVLLHDGVRPIITADLISRNISCTLTHGNAVTCCPSDVTVAISEDGVTVDDVPERSRAYTALAPQSFRLGDIISAHEDERRHNPGYIGVVDACTLLRRQGRPVFMVEGSRDNIKITTPEDYYFMHAILRYMESKDALGL
jgi:2-C-methyl-D-erythritol 4-phosphate cytidylyltransferase